MEGGISGCRLRASTVRITSPLAIPRLHRLGTGGVDGRQAMIQHGAEYFDELLIAIGMLLQLRADLRQSGRQRPVLEGSAVLSAPGLPIGTDR